ncbi:MAG: hypothetical protein PHQ74_11280 [Crocinitomicaceae bacterium]|nr:hypothetical protein [Crocinitomicaceae bacterium]
MKILIISYYAFPLNAVPSYRIESFCEGFTKEGGDVTLLTRHWGASFNSWGDILMSNLKDIEIKKQRIIEKYFYHSKKVKKTVDLDYKYIESYFLKLKDKFKPGAVN